MAIKPAARTADIWIQSIIINDADLTFHHKPLSSWFEEQHRIRKETGEEHRGRQRERRLRGEGAAEERSHIN
ncbi:hypothetical protein E5D57_007919 [Metarhizium anisopliae]|nr:hypothetical protein E5D57_008146 [Metarhizium anisopliae]KAF5131564.1 hypothetical protein E5D57_007919 [Metarhizium anisopliae]